jgi:hypothetical protein
MTRAVAISAANGSARTFVASTTQVLKAILDVAAEAAGAEAA